METLYLARKSGATLGSSFVANRHNTGKLLRPRQEIINGIKKLIDDHDNHIIDVNDLTVESFNEYLSFNDLPELDLIIRTSGETRLSNFMLWQSAYSEYEFVKTLWPDFKVRDFEKIVSTFRGRERRFGGLLAS